MEQVTLSVRVKKEDKEEFKIFCQNMGMDISTAINLFIKAVIREKKIPFEIKENKVIHS